MTNTSIQAKINVALGKLLALAPHKGDDLPLATAFLWDEVERQAKGLSKSAWDKLDKLGKLRTNANTSEKGSHTIATSPHFQITLDCSTPVKRFDPDTLANLLFAECKVPHIKTLELIEKAKVPTKPRLTYAVKERE